jgi:DNA-binding transcriptional LysR family regulator
MELRHLRYFVAVAEELHFRRAAERLHVAQPAVSEQVRKLEEELGVRLLNRTQRSVSLTGPGAAMLEEARRVLHQADRAAAAAREARDGAALGVRIGYLPGALPTSVPRALQQTTASMPLAQVSLETGGARGLIQDVTDGRLDAAVVSLPAPTGNLKRTHVGSQRVLVALPVMHPAATNATIDLEQLAPDRVVLLPRESNPAFHDAAVSMCRDANLSPTFVHTAEPNVELALLAVASGAGLALLPDSAAEHYSVPGVRFIPLEANEPACESVVLTRPDTENLATLTFLRALDRISRRSAPASAPAPARLAPVAAAAA